MQAVLSLPWLTAGSSQVDNYSDTTYSVLINAIISSVKLGAANLPLLWYFEDKVTTYSLPTIWVSGVTHLPRQRTHPNYFSYLDLFFSTLLVIAFPTVPSFRMDRFL